MSACLVATSRLCSVVNILFTLSSNLLIIVAQFTFQPQDIKRREDAVSKSKL